MSFRIAETTHIYNAVVNSCKNAGFSVAEGPTSSLFNVQWTGYIQSGDISDLNKYQRTNHFPGSSQLGRKDLLWRNMNRLALAHPRDFNLAPKSFLLGGADGGDYELFEQE